MVIELLTPPDQFPLEGAQVITLSLWKENELIASEDFPVEMRAGSIENIPEGVPVRAVVEAKDSAGIVIARGRTGRFVLEKGKKGDARVFFSKPGTFSRPKSDMSLRNNYAYSGYTSNSIIFTGGTDINGSALRTTEIYRHDELSFSQFSDLEEPRANHSQVSLKDGKILVISGIGNQGTADGIEMLDPETSGFKKVSRINIPRSNATATLISENEVLICGGYSNNSALNSCEIFNTRDTSIQLLTYRMEYFRYNHSAILLAERSVLLSGGSEQNSIEIFNPTTGAYTLPISFALPRSRHYMDFINQDMVVLACGERSARFELLQLSSMRISTKEESPALLEGCGAHLIDGEKLFVAGGLESGLPTDLAMIIDIETGKVIWSGKMLNERNNPAVILLGDGAILISGGATSPPYAEIFNPPW